MHKKLSFFLLCAIFLGSSNITYCITMHDRFQDNDDESSTSKKVGIALVTLGVLGIGSIAFLKYGYPCCKKLFKKNDIDPWLGMSSSDVEERLREKQQEINSHAESLQSQASDLNATAQQHLKKLKKMEQEVDFLKYQANPAQYERDTMSSIQQQLKQQEIKMQQQRVELEKGKAETKARLKQRYDETAQKIAQYEQQLAQETDPRKKSAIEICIRLQKTAQEHTVSSAKTIAGIDLLN